MVPWALLVLFLTLGTEIQLSHATVVSVNGPDDKLCLYAELMMNFSVTYEVVGDKNETILFELPEEVTTEGSVCDKTSSTLKLNFGAGHSWTATFSKSDTTYQADTITFEYNLSDSDRFPNSKSNETLSVKVNDVGISNVGMDTCYSCKSQVVLPADAVKQTLWNVLIQAFVSDGIKSEIATPCIADIPTDPTAAAPTTAAPTTAAPTTSTTTTTAATTTAPTTTAATTTAPTTTAATTTAPTTSAATTAAPTTSAGNVTTAAPATTTPTTVPTTTPAPTLPPPVIGKYVIKPENGTICLLANFGLRLSFKGEKPQEMNLDPNGTSASGTCGPNTSDLVLTSDTLTIMFTFTNETNKKFHLHALNVSGVISGANSNLSLWEAAVGSSYMCNKEQSFNITDSLTLYTFDLRVQPFEVNNGVFSTAHECSMDDTSILIPIIVGAALAGLILIVVIAYVIGRRKTYVGYQTL